MPNKRSKNQESAKRNLAKRSNPGRSNASTNPNRTAPGKDNGMFFRSKSTIKRLNMYNEKPDLKKMEQRPLTPARIEPKPTWFGNVRTIDQKSLEKLRVEYKQKVNDPYTVLLKDKKMPMSLIQESDAKPVVKLLDCEKYEDTFGPKARRFRPKLNFENLEDLVNGCSEKEKTYNADKDRDLKKTAIAGERDENRDKRIEAGQSKRIWEELYKVLDSSDVICMVLDARDPEGTRCKHVEAHLKNNCPYKHLVYVLNKVDLVPTSVTKAWIKHLSSTCPTIAFRASIAKPFGKLSLIRLFKQFDKFHKDKKTISIGFVGYPNVGKSSVINTIKAKQVCKAAPVPGETKVWQYVALTRRIYMIDCPGVVYDSENQTDNDIVLKGVVRAERLLDPEYYIKALLERVDPEAIRGIYKIDSWADYEDLLDQMAKRMGKLLKGGEPDRPICARILLQDWQRGKIPYHVLPPNYVVHKKRRLADEDEIVEEEKEDEFQNMVDDPAELAKEERDSAEKVF
jgi:nuclear GTP-binding protein